MSIKEGMNRRRFLKNSAVGVLGASALSGSNLLGEEEKPKQTEFKIKDYRTLGRTGFKVSDISTGYVNNAAVLNQLLDAGINYIDTAESYGNEPVVGKVTKERDRKKVFITTKIEVKKDLSKEGFLKRARKCLENLHTDYIDCMMMHGPTNVKTIKTEGFHAAMKQLKTEGKVRFVGISNHGSNWPDKDAQSMEQVLSAAAMDGRFDVMLLAYNFLQQDNGKKVLEICKDKNIGTTLMKVNPVGQYYAIKEYIEKTEKEGKKAPERFKNFLPALKAKADKADFFAKKYNLKNPAAIRDAAIRFCLDNSNVHTVCCAFRNFDDLEKYIKLSGTRLNAGDKQKLAAYTEACGELYCRHACGLCQSQCPNNVPINTIMRYNHYYDAHGREKYAMKKYAQIDTPKADLCAACPGACQTACPYGVPIHGLLNLAHRNLSLV